MGPRANPLRVLLVGEPSGDRATVAAAARRDGDAVVDEELDPGRAIERVAAGEYQCVVIRDAAVADALRVAGVTAPIVMLDGRAAPSVEDHLALAIRAGRAEADAARLRADSLAARASRDDLLSIVAHDLRSPLNAIGLACEALEGELSAEERLRYVAAIRRASLRSERLLRDLIDISRIESGALRLERRLVSARGLIEQVRAAHEATARDAGVELRIEQPAEAGQIFADTERLGQVFAHLIGNSIKHAKGSPITLEIRAEADEVELAVIDRGPGIAADALPHVFDRFYRGRSQRRGGAGLGLAIARGIVDAHGGSIAAVSEPGAGTRFSFRIPRKAVSGASGAGAR